MKKGIINNFTYLSLIHVINIIAPILTYPFVIRVLGADIYGTVIFFQTISMFLGLIINFGSNVTATRDIANTKQGTNELSKLFSTIFLSKIVLWLICIFIISILLSSVDFFQKNKLLFIISFSICFNELLFSVWFYQGIENMVFISILNFISKLIYVVLIFIFLRLPEQYLHVPLFTGLGNLFSGVISLGIIYIKYKIRIIYIPLHEVFKYLISNRVLFFTNTISNLFTHMNRIFIGGFLKMSDVAYYDLAEKIYSLIKTPINIAGITLFPRASQLKNPQSLWKYSKLMLILSIPMLMFLWFFSEKAIVFFAGNMMIRSSTLLNILSLSLIPLILKQYLGYHVLIPLGFNNEHLIAIVMSITYYLILIGIGIVWGVLSIYYYAWLFVTTDFFIVFIYLFYCKKNKIL